MTYTPPTAAIEAVAKVIYESNPIPAGFLGGSEEPVPWEKLGSGWKAPHRLTATAALTAAAPSIAAQAKGEALAPILALHQPFTVHPSGIGTKYCVHCWGSDGSKEWPCATVNVATYPETIEGKSE